MRFSRIGVYTQKQSYLSCYFSETSLLGTKLNFSQNPFFQIYISRDRISMRMVLKFVHFHMKSALISKETESHKKTLINDFVTLPFKKFKNNGIKVKCFDFVPISFSFSFLNKTHQFTVPTTVKPVLSDHIKQDICLVFQTGLFLLHESSAESMNFLHYFHAALSHHLSIAISMSPKWMVT